MNVLTSKPVLVLGKSGWDGLPAVLPLIPSLSWGLQLALRKSSHPELSSWDVIQGAFVWVLPNRAMWPWANHLPPSKPQFPHLQGGDKNVHFRASFIDQIHILR